MKFDFLPVPRPDFVESTDWRDWRWQLRQGLKTAADFSAFWTLQAEEEQALLKLKDTFQTRATPYYAALADPQNPRCPIRLMAMPNLAELAPGRQQMADPLGERRHSPRSRLIHRYPDRVLFLVTDMCSVYCRFCTRKYFTGQEQTMIRDQEYQSALEYIRQSPGVREVILSGGDPLTLGDAHLERILRDLRAIEHIEIIRIGTRMPVVCPMRVTEPLAEMLRRFAPVFVMTHFNHPKELTAEAREALGILVDHGVPVMNQMVLLNGINNHAAHVQALSRRLLYLRVKPYYLFQADPSEGTDHLRTSVDQSLSIQRELWGRLSGLALPPLSLDIPGGGGKVPLYPNFEVSRSEDRRHYRGWDGIEADYREPRSESLLEPADLHEYLPEWETIKFQNYGSRSQNLEAGVFDDKFFHSPISKQNTDLL